jgi:hypothetical protein
MRLLLSLILGGECFLPAARLWLSACGVGLSLHCYRSGRVCFWLSAYGVGLSLHSYRSISFAPVRGGTYFLCRRKESRQRKRAATASL